MRAILTCAVVVAIAVAGCNGARPCAGCAFDSGPSPDAFAADASTDAAMQDAGLVDANARDATMADTASGDANAVDASSVDANAVDASSVDANAVDASSVDASSVDARSTADAGPGSCTAASGCAAPMQYCHTPMGMCGGAGTCTAFSSGMICPLFVSPVCGCDGMSYSNYCFAARAGRSIAHAGACATGGCASNSDCSSTTYCSFPDGVCGGTGTCQSRGLTLFCIMTCTPECGCDGVSYRNACYRHKQGTSLASPGTCPGSTPPC